MDNTIYEPREDSYLLQKFVSDFCKKGDFVLDMGTGTGIQAITAAKKAEIVIACDINPEAIRQASMTASIEKIKNIEFIKSDLFRNVPDMKFDLIMFNPPYLPEEKDISNIALFSGKRGVDTAVKFLGNVTNFLKENGTILMVGSSLSSQSLLQQAFNENLLTTEMLETQHIFFEDIFVMQIKKSHMLKKLSALKITDAKLFARGKRGVIVKASYNGKTVAIKSKKPGSEAHGTIDNEARILSVINKKGIGPKLIMQNNEFLMYKFVNGIFIEDFIEKNNKSKIKSVLKKVFDQLYSLDKLGINKFEMHHPTKHVIINKTNPVLIDFERARYTKDPKNVTQFCDYLSGDNMLKILNTKGFKIKRANVISLARKYKKSLSEKEFKDILSMLT